MTVSIPQRKTVLVAADTPFVRDRFKAALDASGHRAVVVKSVAQLLARVHADLDELDLIVLDLRMPHASGAELVRRIRKLDQGRLPILVFGGSVTSAEEVRELAGLGVGVGGYLNEYSAVEHILPSIAPHLFPDNFNRRGGPRVVMGIPVSYRAGGTIAAALSLNLSRGGIAIRTSGPLPRETVLKLRFALPGSKREMEAEAVVCWSDERAGMGIRFTSVKPADQAAIDEFVNAHFFRSVKT
ncbi:MAG: TIGR02266 family protein [Acidobacteriota bacterium]|nr:TIGR02266 family protein [Acidobacteriota bacterium]